MHNHYSYPVVLVIILIFLRRVHQPFFGILLGVLQFFLPTHPLTFYFGLNNLKTLNQSNKTRTLQPGGLLIDVMLVLVDMWSPLESYCLYQSEHGQQFVCALLVFIHNDQQTENGSIGPMLDKIQEFVDTKSCTMGQKTYSKIPISNRCQWCGPVLGGPACDKMSCACI